MEDTVSHLEDRFVSRMKVLFDGRNSWPVLKVFSRSCCTNTTQLCCQRWAFEQLFRQPPFPLHTFPVLLLRCRSHLLLWTATGSSPSLLPNVVSAASTSPPLPARHRFRCQPRILFRLSNSGRGCWRRPRRFVLFLRVNCVCSFLSSPVSSVFVNAFFLLVIFIFLFLHLFVFVSVI